MKGRLFITKPIELARQEAADTERGLRRALGPLDLVAYSDDVDHPFRGSCPLPRSEATLGGDRLA